MRPRDAPDTSLAGVFDMLADQLCLLQFTAHLSAGQPAYGSAARTRAVSDERDEAQWFCADVLEPAFSASLPRLCAQLRAKCFGPGPAAVPNTPRRMKRTVSAPSAQPRADAPRAADLHEILSGERARPERRRSGLARPPAEVHMSRRFVRTSSATQPLAPVHKRKRPAMRRPPAERTTHTLVSATPEHVRTVPWPPAPPSPESPSASPSVRRTSLLAHAAKPEELADDQHALRPSSPMTPEPCVDMASNSPVPSPTAQRHVPDAPTVPDDEEPLVIPAARKAAIVRDPLSLL